MSMQTDVKVSQYYTPAYSYSGISGTYPLCTPDGQAIGSCRIKAIVVGLTTYDDGSSYGGLIQLGNAKSDGSGYSSLFSINVFPPGYSPSGTVTWLMPGEGILAKDNLWWYSDGSNYCWFYVVYG